MRRKILLEKVTNGMSGVKHVVLTQKNFKEGLKSKIQESRKNLLRIRKQEILGKVTGGCASLEFTNEERGWHMHWHLLLQSAWIEASKLSIAWGQLVEQEFAIVKVMDVSEKSYLQELLKYVAKGSEIASWSPAQILEFVLALQGTRCFTTFGRFKQIAKFARGMIEADKEPHTCKECGMPDFVAGHDREHCKRIATKKGY